MREGTVGGRPPAPPQPAVAVVPSDSGSYPPDPHQSVTHNTRICPSQLSKIMILRNIVTFETDTVAT